MSEPPQVARTNGLFLATIPAVAGTVASVVAVGSTIVNSVRVANRWYATGKKIYGYAQPVFDNAAYVTNALAPVVTAEKTVDTATAASAVMSGLLLWNGWTWLADSFTKKHGEWKAAQLQLAHTQKLAGPKLAGISNSDDSLEWKAYRLQQMGKITPNWLKGLPVNNRILIGGMLTALATYLHSEGSQLMKKHTESMQTDYVYPLESGVASYDLGPPGLKRLCYNLYFNNDYYTAANSKIAYISAPYNNHIVRIIINTLLGLFQQMGLVSSDANDPVDSIITAAELVGYWEITAHLVGLYGWAPVYVATQWLAQSLLSARAPKTRKK
jgi:hypothetical protein